MKKLVTGITSSGNITLGNYLGVIKKIKQLSKEYESYIFVADLHGLTLPRSENNPSAFFRKSMDIAALYYASGLTGKNVNIFYQSDIPQISELAYILATNSTIGELNRMTQYKDKLNNLKLKNNTESIPTGLLIYPILMAADILSFNADIVPTGIDQKQHLELSRNLAQRLNSKYKTNLSIPEPLIFENQKIMALQEPNKKMSKSDTNVKNTIYLLNNKSEISKKIQIALTDSDNKIKFDIKTKPGISNLMNIYSMINDISINEIEKKYQKLGYSEFKTDLIKIVLDEILPIQKRYEQIIDNPLELNEFINKGTKQAIKEADKTIREIKLKVLGK